MRRFVTLASSCFFFTIPFGVSISGCSKKSPTVFCNGGDSGIPCGAGHDHYPDTDVTASR